MADADAPDHQAAVYVIDTSALVDLRLDYPLTVFARLWDRFVSLARDGRLLAPEEVRHELGRRDDELKRWASGVEGLFRAPDVAFMASLARVVREFEDLVDLGRRYSADAWVVALALQLHESEQATLFPRPCVVITHERRETNPGARLRIPNACDHYGLGCLRLRDVFVAEGWQDL